MFSLTLVTPEKKIVTDIEIAEVIVPAYRGELDILPGHAPLMTTLSNGILRYRLKDTSQFEKVAISWGYCEVNPTGVNILAETAEVASEIDFSRVRLALKISNEKLNQGRLNQEETMKYQRKVKRALTRLQLEEKESSH